MSQVFVGIDLGTTNSSLAFVQDDVRYRGRQADIPVTVLQIPHDAGASAKSGRFPSIIAMAMARNQNRDPLVGWDAVRPLTQVGRRIEPLRHGFEFVRSVKSDMGTNRVYPYATHPSFRSPVDASAHVLQSLIKIATRETAIDFRHSRVVITVPASFGELARRDTREAALRAGIPGDHLEMLDEPVAALVHLLDTGSASQVLDGEQFKHILIFDYGGGTCDLTLVKARYDSTRPTGIHLEPLAISEYRQLGGDDVDRAIMADVIWPQVERRTDSRDHLTVETRLRIEDTLTFTAACQLKERACELIARAGDHHEREHHGTEAVDIRCPVVRVPDVGKETPGGYRMTLSEFERCMEPFLRVRPGDLETLRRDCPRSLLLPVYEVLEEAGLSPLKLDAVVMHGGSCRNPLVQRLLASAFTASSIPGQQRTKIMRTPDLDTSVAAGAALVAYWKHARGTQIVRPILGEEFGIIAQNDVPVALIRAGTPLPFPDEGVYTAPTEFYLPGEEQRELLVPTYRGSRYRLAGSTTVPVPPGLERGAAVRIKLRMEEDKRLDWWFSIEGSADVQATGIPDPTTAELPTPEWDKVLRHRRAMREELDRSGTISRQTALSEASLLYDAERFFEARVAVEDLLREDATLALAWNLKALMLFIERRWPEAAAAFARATELEQGKPVYRGNHGVALAESGQVEEGVAAIRTALAADPGVTYLYEWLGDIYRSAGREQAALNEYGQAAICAARETTEFPSWREAWQRKARIHRKLGEYAHAEEADERWRGLKRDAAYRGESKNLLGILWRGDNL